MCDFDKFVELCEAQGQAQGCADWLRRLEVGALRRSRELSLSGSSLAGVFADVAVLLSDAAVVADGEVTRLERLSVDAGRAALAGLESCGKSGQITGEKK